MENLNKTIQEGLYNVKYLEQQAKNHLTMCDQLKIGDNQQNELKDFKEQEITTINTE